MGVAAPGTVEAGAAVAVGALGTDGVALLAAAGDSVVLAAGGAPNSDGLPLWICQLFQRSNSEKEKIIQRTVRRISMVPTEVNTGQQSPPV
jgi:hypothetical protein